jgi:methylthioribose-1-phosphate isomerase
VSAGKDAPREEPPREEPPREEPGTDLDRRSFFRGFSRDAIQTAATVLGAASALRRESIAAASGLLGLSSSLAASAEWPANALDKTKVNDRGPYRLADGVVRILDQRRLPAAAISIECRDGGEVAAAMRDLAARGGPLLGQLAAYGMALAAERSIASTPYARFLALRGTGDALREARPDVAAVAVAVDRCVSAWQATREPGDGAEIAAAVRAVAEAIATEANTGLSRLGRDGADLIAQPDGRPIEILTIDATGPLSGGVAGTAMGIILAIAAAGRAVHAWVAETRPWLTGARVAALELKASDVPCTVIADGAVGWLLRERRVDAVLVGAERIAANGDFANATGTYPLAVLAARHDVPLYVCAPLAAVDGEAPDGSSLIVAMRPAGELLPAAGEAASPAQTDALVPLDDVTPAELVRAYITDAGVLRPPFRLTVVERPA